MIVLAIDPGDKESAVVHWETAISFNDGATWGAVQQFGILPNDKVLEVLRDARYGTLAVEMIASYGMPVGREVFETCVWIGRFVEAWTHARGKPFTFVYRRDVKLHLCGSPRAKDANVRQALIDKWGGKQLAIGTKASPGPLYGVKADCWAALGVAVTYAEVLSKGAVGQHGTGNVQHAQSERDLEVTP